MFMVAITDEKTFMAATDTNNLKIGDVAKQTGTTAGGLRYYEELGLIHSVRGKNGYRYYSQSIVNQVQFIKKAQLLGFSLEDIRDILTVHHRGDLPCNLVQSLLREKIQQLEAKIREMQLFKTELETYSDLWESGHSHPQPDEICPLIEMVPLTNISEEESK